MEEVSIVLEGSRRMVEFCPVSARVERSGKELQSCELLDLAEDRPVPFQVDAAAGGSVIHWIVESIAPGQRKRYLLRESEGDRDWPLVSVEPGGDAVDVTLGGELFTRYLYSDTPKPCLYPLVGPFGEGVTRAYPMEEVEGDSTDHIHHRSLWTAWGNVNGSDNWGEAEGCGRMEHRYFDQTDSGPVFGRLAALNDWVDDSGERVLQDRIEYRFYNVPSSFRLFDLDVTLYASDGEVEFGDTKEGGILSVRVASPLEVNRTGRIENALGGIDEKETWGKRAPWCDYSGWLGRNQVGIAGFDHPSNLRYPTYWHVRNYGLMTANPFGLSFFVDENVDGSYVLPDGGRVKFRYRVYIHPGDAAEGRVREKYLDWLFPPSATVEE